MAIKPADLYPGKTTPADAAYTLGSAKNIAVAGDDTGTPLDKDWVNDIWGFLQALLAAGGVTPSGTPDTAIASQYLAALQSVIGSISASASGRVMVKAAETVNTGVNPVIVEGTLALPAGKNWKWVRVVFGTYLGANQSFGTVNKVEIDTTDDTALFGIASSGDSTVVDNGSSHTLSVEGPPSVIAQDITVKVSVDNSADATGFRSAYIVGEYA